MQKQKILCLHGYRQNSDKFRSQTGALRKILKNQADFTFISAPHKITESGQSEEDQRSWWFTKVQSFNAKDQTDLDMGFSESLTIIEQIFENEGSFDGILGFSQGAALAGLLCALKSRNKFKHSFKFVILISGFKSLSEKHAEFYDRNITIPSLHVFGETDQIINKEMSKDLAALFVNPVILNHSGGHFVPGTSLLKKHYVDFITKQDQEFLEDVAYK